MRVLLDGMVLNGRPTGYLTVVREHLLALNRLRLSGEVPATLNIILVAQRRAVPAIDPTGSLRRSGLLTIVSVPSMPTLIRVLFQQLCLGIVGRFYRCDVIHCPATLGLIWPSMPQIVFFQASTTFRLPRRMHGRGFLATATSNYIIKRSVKRSAVVTVTTKTTGEELRAYVGGPLPYQIIGNGMQCFAATSPGDEQVSDAVRQFTRKKFLLYVSTFFRLKNHRLLIDAAHRLPYEVILVGGIGQADYYEECKQAAKQKSNVSILRAVSQADLRFLYENCVAYVCPSLFEGFGLTPLEALQYGKPIFLAELDVLREVYGNGFNYFDPRSVDSLITCVKGMTPSYEAFCRSSNLSDKYSWEAFARKNVDLYLQCAARTKQ